MGTSAHKALVPPWFRAAFRSAADLRQAPDTPHTWLGFDRTIPSAHAVGFGFSAFFSEARPIPEKNAEDEPIKPAIPMSPYVCSERIVPPIPSRKSSPAIVARIVHLPP